MMTALLEQTISVAAALMLVISFALLAQRRMHTLLHWFAAQGLVLAFISLLVAYVSGAHELYISAIITLILKGLLLPWLLWRIVIRLDIYREVESLVKVPVMLFLGAALTVFSYHIALPLSQLAFMVTRKTLAISIACLLIGLLMMITRRNAVTQVVAFLSIENAIFFTATGASYGMPMVVELGVAFDVLIAALVFGLFSLHIRSTFDSLDLVQMESETK